MIDAFLWESRGVGNFKQGVVQVDNERVNGYILGKKWMTVTVDMWKHDVKHGLLFIHELYEEEKFPRWWLDEVLTTRKSVV